MPGLIAPTVRLHAGWLEAHDEWGPGVHEDGFGLHRSDETDSPAGFAAWVSRLVDQADPAQPLDAGRVHCTYRWIVESDRVLGGIALRHASSDYVLWAGHIGLGIRPSARRRGLATWALSRMVEEARVLGLDRVLAVCAVDNVASLKTIERSAASSRAFGTPNSVPPGVTGSSFSGALRCPLLPRSAQRVIPTMFGGARLTWCRRPGKPTVLRERAR